ncbi:MAG: 3-deoxy-D-manno-octulosonic acid transferase [Sphingobacteriaceae bacterium]|jgi:3-deoxy-D-manno-octulosonic-acid transferase|nr:3-deoxy-D-manno-octulosonic acid transferase [Sphingobacteriaceae bacterium]
MRFLYNIGIYVYIFLIQLSAIFNKKAKLWIAGRKNILERIKSEVNGLDKHIWFHFASLGEFEQGRTVLEKIKEEYPDRKILITFFSPSGYEVRKNYSSADYVFYLPADTPRNAREFIRFVNPELAVFTKYDYWLNYFLELKHRGVKLYVISAIFHPQYSFFRWYGLISRKMLRLVTTVFVQDQNSKELLSSIGINNVIVNGDTRFDRVAENAAHPKSIEPVANFAGTSNVLVAGSTWTEDEKLLSRLCSSYPDWKLIIAPHEVNKSRIAEAQALFGDKAILFSTLHENSAAEQQVLIIDNIGMLSSLYRYGQIAYIGGGFGVGIHNTLEAAAFSKPVIFGPNYQRFREAVELLELGGTFTIKSEEDLQNAMQLLQDESYRSEAGAKAGDYVSKRTGATEKIVRYIFDEDNRTSAD